MKTSLRTIFTAVLVILCAVYCTPNDLNDIKKRVDDIEGRVATLEEQVKTMNEQTIPGLRSLVTAITTDNVWVTAVVQQESGYEIKFSDGKFTITKEYEEHLRERLSIFRQVTHNNYGVLHTFITPYGIAKGIHNSIVNAEVTAESLLLD